MKDRRWNLRISASSQVVVSSENTNCLASLENISLSGARLEGVSGPIADSAVGTCLRLIVQFGAQAFHQVTATVVNRDSVGLGLSFDRALQVPTFDRIVLSQLVSGSASL